MDGTADKIVLFVGVVIGLGVISLVMGSVLTTTVETVGVSESVGNEIITLTSNGNLVPVSGYDVLTEADIGSFIANTTHNMIVAESDMRIRQSGTVEEVFVKTGADATNAALTGVWFTVWDKNGSTYDLVGESANVVSQYQAIGNDTEGTIPITISGVGVGDYMGIRTTTSGGTVSMIDIQSGDNAIALYRTNGAWTSTGFDWESQLTGTAQPQFQYKMKAPSIVFIGDSITAGAPAHDGYIIPNGNDDAPTTSVPYKTSAALGVAFQNMGDGRSGLNESADGLARFTEDVVDLNPRAVVIGFGTADVNVGVSEATFSSNMQSMITEAQNADIIPIIQKIYPRDYDTLGVTDAKDTERLNFNTELESLAISNNIPIIDTDISVGDGNTPLGMNPSHDSGDNIHFNEAGHTAIAEVTQIAFISSISNSWAAAAANVNQTSQSAFGLLLVVVIIIAAVVILSVIKQF